LPVLVLTALASFETLPMRIRRWVGTALIVAAAIVVTPAVPARAADEAPLIPIATFLASPKAAWEHRVSPDGTRLAWVAMHNGRATLHFRGLAETKAHTVATPRELRPPLGLGSSFGWTSDGKRLLFLMDGNGDENAHLYAVDLEAREPAARDLTPLSGVQVSFYRLLSGDSNAVIVAHNGRDRRLVDLYRLNLTTGGITLHVQNPGDVCGWTLAGTGQVQARRHCHADGGWSLTVSDGAGGWREAVRGVYGDGLRLLGFASARHAWALSSRGRDKLALVRLDLLDGSEEPIHEAPGADIAGGQVQESGWVRYVWAWPARQDWRFFDAALQADLGPFLKQPRTVLRLLSEDRNLRLMTFATRTDKTDERVYLLDRTTRDLKVLAEASMAAHAEHLAPMEPVTFPARDGLIVHGLLTVPVGAKRPRPMVLMVHGGPWSRDYWGYDPVVQLLANRGYVVLQVNYRGSDGYGRDYMLAGTREFGRKMHDDLIDGVRWAVALGIADERKVAIAGSSYGGYAALSGLAFTPGVFAAGVDRVGVADMLSLRTDAPPQWYLSRGFHSRFYGDPDKADDRRIMIDRSPLTHIGAIGVPLLVAHGANDIRVKRDHSDRVVAALKARKHAVEYLLFEDEGHSINLTPNRVAFWRAVERFLARHLGGREEGQ
jgi:dipeptidyl aminopeptidase/acylaminoacyl peptidase